MADNCPCRKDCPDRAGGCHSPACPHGWYERNEQHNAERKERNKRYMEALTLKEVKFECIKRMTRRKV